MVNDKIALTNRVLSIGVLLLNLPLIFFTIKIVVTVGGPWGYGLLALPYLFVAHLFIINAIYWLKRSKKLKLSLVINILGILYCSWIVYPFLYPE